MRISVFGLGYVGAVSLACLARDGHQLIGLDIDPVKRALIGRGKSPVVEQGLAALMAEGVASGRITVRQDVTQALQESELSLICVGTPSAGNGSQDQSALLRLVEQLGAALRHQQQPHVLVFRSTLVPGCTEELLIPRLQAISGRREGQDFHVCCQPEFLREGSALRDFARPPFTVVGARNGFGVARLRALQGHLPCPFVVTSLRTAEMLKLCCNNFHALKITFANETARLCQALGVDAFAVMELMCQDRQLNLSAAYLRPGFAFGGSCLPKDLRATTYLARSHDVELPMLSGVLPSNQLQLELALKRLLALGKRRIGLLGLSFKHGTDDLRESPMVALAEQLLGKGFALSVYDPEVQLARLLGSNMGFVAERLPHIGAMLEPDLARVIRSSEVLVLAQASEEVLQALASYSRSEQLLLDLVHLPPGCGIAARVEGLCW